MDIAVVGVGVALVIDASGTCTSARVALGPLHLPCCWSRLRVPSCPGSGLEEASLARMAEAVRAACKPIDDKRERGIRTAMRPCSPGGWSRLLANGRERSNEQSFVSATVNGDPQEFLCDPSETLLDVLAANSADRIQGRLRSAIAGPAPSCSTARCLLLPGLRRRGPGPPDRHDRRRRRRRRTPSFQRKFLEHGALQCGFCTPGFIVASKPARPQPGAQRHEVRYWLAGNLCRCTVTTRSWRAVMDAAPKCPRSSDAKDPAPRHEPQAEPQKSRLSAMSARVRFAPMARKGHRQGDLRPRFRRPGMIHGAMLRSPHAHRPQSARSIRARLRHCVV